MYLAAMQLFNQKNWQEARESFQNFVTQYPRSRWLVPAKLRLADMESDATQAISMYEALVEQNGENEWGQDARWALASSLFTLGSYSAALSHLEILSRLAGPWQASSLYLLGLTQSALKRYPEAEISFQRVLELFPKSSWAPLALVGLGDAELADHKVDEALKSFNRYLSEYPEGDLTHQVLWQKSQALNTQKSGEKSSGLLEELVERFPESFESEHARTQTSDSETMPTVLTVQVGAFTKPEYALKLVQRLCKKGYNAYILPARTGNEVFNQVRVGRYTSRDIAQKIAEKLGKNEKLPYIILPYVNPGKNQMDPAKKKF